MLTDQQKYEIIEKYKADYTMNQIAVVMNINKSTIVAWLKRYVNDNTVSRKKYTCKSNCKKKTTIDGIDISIIYNMLSNMHIRIHKVIEAQGDVIDY